MTKFTSRYAELGFYVNGEFKRFVNGEYRTNDPDEIAVLNELIDAVPVDVPKETPEETEKPIAKTPRKGAAKSSE